MKSTVFFFFFCVDAHVCGFVFVCLCVREKIVRSEERKKDKEEKRKRKRRREPKNPMKRNGKKRKKNATKPRNPM